MLLGGTKPPLIPGSTERRNEEKYAERNVVLDIPKLSLTMLASIQGLLVYVNYGTIDDFLYLKDNLTLDLDGRICIARYGNIFRGDKVSRYSYCCGMELHAQIVCMLKTNMSYTKLQYVFLLRVIALNAGRVVASFPGPTQRNRKRCTGLGTRLGRVCFDCNISLSLPLSLHSVV